MKCPVCKTECGKKSKCPECGFAELNPIFISKEEAEYWQNATVWEWRYKYWKTLKDYEFYGKTIVKYSGKKETVSVPYGVDAIGEDAFKNNKSIRNIYFPDTLREIGTMAFYATKVQCAYLPDGLEAILDGAFETSDLLAISIPGSCKIIDCNAFSSCYHLKSAILARGVQEIGSNAFAWCSNLGIVSIPNTVEFVGVGAFSSGSKKLHMSIEPNSSGFYISNNCLINKKSKTLISGNLSGGIPQGNTITAIGKKAYINERLDGNYLKIPSNIERIDENAFLACDFDNIDILIPETVKSVGEGAFFLVEKCRIFCEASSRPNEWAINWCCANNYQVYWHDEWEMVDGQPKLIAIKTPLYVALLDSYWYDSENEQLKIKIRLENHSALAVRFNFIDIIINDEEKADECTMTHYYVLNARSNVTCCCTIDDSDFEGLFIKDSKRISFVTTVEDENGLTQLSKGNSITLLGFGTDCDELPF